MGEIQEQQRIEKERKLREEQKRKIDGYTLHFNERVNGLFEKKGQTKRAKLLFSVCLFV